MAYSCVSKNIFSKFLTHGEKILTIECGNNPTVRKTSMAMCTQHMKTIVCFEENRLSPLYCGILDTSYCGILSSGILSVEILSCAILPCWILSCAILSRVQLGVHLLSSVFVVAQVCLQQHQTPTLSFISAPERCIEQGPRVSLHGLWQVLL